MSVLSSFLVALSLSMDNLAVTVSAGCSRAGKATTGKLLKISLLFALAHFVMFGVGFEGGILMRAGRTLAPWIACAILVFIGARMIKNALLNPSPEQAPIFHSWRTQGMLAIATSVDALLVGASLALTSAAFWQAASSLAVCVFVTSLCGFYLGCYLGHKFGRNMEIIGGVVLMFLGMKVLLEGVGIW